jgi:hypothetical protein
VLSLAGAGGAAVPVGAPALVDVEAPALGGALGTSMLSDAFVSEGTGGTGTGVTGVAVPVLSVVGIGVSVGTVGEGSVVGSEGAAPVPSVVGVVVSGDGVPEGSVVSPAEGSVVSPEVPEGAVPEVSVVAGSAVPVVAPEMSEVAPFEAGGGGSSARAVATNAEAQRKVATRATAHPRTPGDRRPSQRGSSMLRTPTQFRSSTLSLTWPSSFWNVRVLHLRPETQARNVAGLSRVQALVTRPSLILS